MEKEESGQVQDLFAGTPDALNETIEDAQKGRLIDVERALSDEQLIDGGLAPVRAFVRTKQGKAAARQKRYKEKKVATGVRQLNVQVPDGDRDSVKRISEVLRAGGWRAALIRFALK